MFLRLLAECTHDRPLHGFVRILQCLSSWSTVRFPQHSGILHPYKICSICLVVITFQFVLRIFAVEDLCEHGHHHPKTLLSWSRLARATNEELDCPPTTVFLLSIMKGFIFFTHFCDCSVKTALIYRSNCAKNSCNRVLVGTSLIEYHFFSEPRPRNDHCPAGNLFAYRETRLALDSQSFSLSFDPHEMSLNIDMKIILLVKFSGVSSNLSSKLLTSWLSCNALYPGNIFHSKSIGSPSILSKFLYSWDVLKPSQSIFPCSVWLGVLVYRIRKDVDLRALKIDNSFVTNQWQVLPWMILPTSCFHSIDLILFRHQFCRYV